MGIGSTTIYVDSLRPLFDTQNEKEDTTQLSFQKKVRFIKQQLAYRASHYPGATLVDAKTVAFEASDFDNIMRFMLFTV